MKKTDWIIVLGIALFIACGGFLYFYFRNKETEQENAQLKEDNLRLVLEALKQNPNLSDEIKRQLQNLIARYENIDAKVANELVFSVKLMDEGNVETAIQNLVKIIEHLLSAHYKDDESFIAWCKKEKKKLDLFAMLTYCKFQQKINDIEFQFFMAIKKIRDKEVHLCDLQIDDYLNASGLITAVGGVMKVSTVVYPTKKLR